MAERFPMKRIILPALVILILISAFFPLIALGSAGQAPKPTAGVLDLSSWDFSQGRPSLNGGWAFYWDKLYTYADFQSGNISGGQIADVPKTWNSYIHDGKNLPGFGYATYRLRVIVADASQPLSLRLDTMSTAYRLYIDDRELTSGGAVGMDQVSSVPDYQPRTVTFQPPAREFDLIVQASNFTYARGGVWYEIHMGTSDQIDALDRMTIYKDAILIGSLLIMALYYACFYIVLQRDKSSLYFMILCVIFIFRISLYGDVVLVRLFPHIPYGLLIFLTYATLYWIPVVIFQLVDSIFASKHRLPLRWALMLYGGAATALTAVLPIRLYTACVTGIEAVGITIVVLSVGLVVKALRRRQKGAGLILMAVFVILITGVHDVLYQANVIHHALGELASVGIFLFMFTFSFIIAGKLSDAYEKEKQLTMQLGESLRKEKAATDELIRTELSFLKAQIKPHFLYNSLSIITALTTKDPPRAKALLYDLSDYLRGSFNFENYNGVTPIQSEINTVRAYLAIEKERFPGKLNIEYEIDETIDISVPLLTIQPLVENAIRHGIMKKSGGKTVRLSVQKGKGGTVITVRDDGVGMSLEKLAGLFDMENTKSGVGLKNIQRRLILYYGHGLVIESAEGKGTTVTITIPGD